MDLRSTPARVVLVAVLAMVWMGAALVRLGYLQIICYSDYLSRAHRQQQRIIEISPKRGSIYDRNGRELAMSVQVDSCFAVPSEINDADMVARLLAGILNQPEEEIAARLSASRSFVWIARKLPPKKAERIQALNLRGIYFQKENQRIYPKRRLAAHVLGYVDLDEKGLAGVEYELDSEIRGTPGRMLVLTDARRRWFERTEKAADAGSSVMLTLDENIQYIAERELAAAIRQTHALAGSVIVQDPNTGALLAMANWPTFNPNAAGDGPADAHMDRAIGALYEPGSTFKIVTVGAALEQGITRPTEVIDCQMGAIYIAGHRIRDHKPFGLLTVAQVLSNSSDIGAIKLGLRLGAPKMYDYIRAFGFGTLTGVDLPGETRGIVRRVENWSAISIGAVSMGQEIGITPIQLTSAMSAIANGGLLYRPYVVRELRRAGRIMPMEQPEPRRAIAPQTAATLRQLLESVILKGTGKLAGLEGYSAAGKTGTAQKVDPATGRYSPSQLIASFVGFAPVNNPAVTILVTLDSPVGPHHGGDVAAPVFKRIAEPVLAYLNTPHDVEVTPGLRRASLKRNADISSADLSDFDPLQVQDATGETPAARAPALPKSPAPTVALAEGEGIAVPQLAGQTVRGVTEECLRLGLNPVLVGTGLAVEQSPEAGAVVRRGSSVTVRFGRTPAQARAAGRGN
jgi:cell division protein FtsI (penicillin-binding protein 3)